MADNGLPQTVGLCPDPSHTGEFYVPHGGRCPAEGCHEQLVEYATGGIVDYWRNTYARRTEEAHKLRGALVVIASQLDVLDELPWWRFRRRRRHELAIRDTLRVV